MQTLFHSQHRVDELIQNLHPNKQGEGEHNPTLTELESLLLEKLRFNIALSRKELGFFDVEEIILSPIN